MAAKKDGDIDISIYINQQYELTNNINSFNDQVKTITFSKNNTLRILRKNIIGAFSEYESFISLFKNYDYEWRIYSYHAIKAEVEIADDDDLKDEIDTNIETDSDSDDDHSADSQAPSFKLRVVFFRSMSYDM